VPCTSMPRVLLSSPERSGVYGGEGSRARVIHKPARLTPYLRLRNLAALSSV
jgi:hypothetical protein